MDSATGILTALATAGALVLAGALGKGLPDDMRLVLSGLAVAAIVVAGVVYLRSVRRPLQSLAGTLRASLAGTAEGPVPGHGPVRPDLLDIGQRIDLIAQRNRELERALAAAEERRARAVEAQHEAEERYALAVERANDGVWEYAIDSGTATFSARWQSMAACRDRPPRTIEEWYDRLHPDDADAVRMALKAYLEGLTSSFEAEYRIRCDDGAQRWIHSRGTALRHASGKLYRLLVQDNDVHERRTLEATLVEAAESMSMLSGQDLFRKLAQTLATILGTRDNLVCACEGEPPRRARALAYYTRGEFREAPLEYDLEGTSCGDVIARGEIVYCPSGVCDLWPIERQYDRESYLGVPMFDSGGRVIGHFACMDGGPMRHDMPHLALFKIFAVRAAAELERVRLKARLESDTPSE